MRILIPCLLGLERPISFEIEALGYRPEQIRREDGLVLVNLGDVDDLEISSALAEINLWLRTGERVMLEIAEAEIRSFDDLFEFVAAQNWEHYWPRGHYIEFDFFSLKSQIYGETAASQIAKKAIAQRLLKAYGDVGQRYLPEDKALGRFKVQLAFRDDRLQLRLDCTGAALHKRGYRQLAGPAPLRETLAASFLSLMRFKPFSDELLWDPCCGSGTIAIEAAMIAANMAPGLRRRFACEVFPFFSTKAIVEARNRAKQELDLEAPEQPFIFASDIDPELLDLASENAKKFGLENFIRFFRSDFCRPYDSVPRILDQAERCLIISNPPYGLRISDQRSVRELHYAFRKRCFNSDGLKPSYRLGLITSSKDLEEDLAQPADKRRKLYNGMIEACFYQWFKHPRVARNA